MGDSDGDEEWSGDGGSLRLRPLASTEDGFSLSHAYFEVVYGPLLGPTAVLVARAMARHLEAAGGPTTVSPVDVAREVGIRTGSSDVLGQRSHFVRALGRLSHHRVVVPLGDRILGVRLFVAPLGAGALDKLPPHAREAHQRFVARPGE